MTRRARRTRLPARRSPSHRPTDRIFSQALSAELRTQTLCLDAVLRMLHPVAPFATEELWQHLQRTLGRWREGETSTALCAAPFPDTSSFAQLRDVEADAVHASVQKISLRCCITLKPLVDPAKGVCCTHPATANFADLAAAWTAQL